MARARTIATATAGPSTALLTKCVSNFALAESRTGGSKNNGKSWLGQFVHSHLRRMKPRRRWAPRLFGWFRKTTTVAATLVRLRTVRFEMMPSAWAKEEARHFRFYFAYQ